MCRATIFPYPFEKEGGGSVGTYSNRSPSTCVPLRESIAATCSTWQADGYLSHEGFQWAWLRTHIVNFVFINVNLHPTPSWDRDGFISKIWACLNAVNSSPGCPHCSSERLGQTHFIHHALPWHINYAARPCIPQFTPAIKFHLFCLFSLDAT